MGCIERCSRPSGDVIFKLTGNTQSTQPLEDDFSNVIFKLVSLHRVGNNQVELILSITNNGEPRDLKAINGLITITDFNKRNYDAQRGNWVKWLEANVTLHHKWP